MNSRYIRLLASAASTILIMLVIVMITSEENPNRILVMLGGTMPEGLIQGFTLFLFILGLLELYFVNNKFDRERDAFKLGLLPEKDNWVLAPDDVNDIKLKAIKFEKHHNYLLVNLIKKTCTKYRLSKSSSEALELVETQIRTYQMRSESEQSIIRYIAWAIPSVGFIGTVVGIAASLGIANQATTPEGIEAVTSMLAVAFDTTLVALVYSLILMFFIHAIQEKENKLFAQMSDHLVDNLINRLYK